MKNSKNKKWIKLKRMKQYKTALMDNKKVFDFNN